MAIKNLIALGLGFDAAGDTMTKYLPTLGYGSLAGGVEPGEGGEAGGIFLEQYRGVVFVEQRKDMVEN